MIADNNNIPTLFTAENGIKYIPIDSVYAIGEVKSSYRKSEDYLQKFSDVIKDIRNDLYHKEIKNTCYGGIESKGDFIIRDMIFDTDVQILNRLFFFMILVDSSDFNFEDVANLYKKTDLRYLPNVVVLLNKGVIVRGSLTKDSFTFNKYPEEIVNGNEDWFFQALRFSENGSLEGSCLVFLYYCIVEHLSKSYLEPPSLSNFIKDILKVSKSLMQKTSDY